MFMHAQECSSKELLGDELSGADEVRQRFKITGWLHYHRYMHIEAISKRAFREIRLGVGQSRTTSFCLLKVYWKDQVTYGVAEDVSRPLLHHGTVSGYLELREFEYVLYQFYSWPLFSCIHPSHSLLVQGQRKCLIQFSIRATGSI